MALYAFDTDTLSLLREGHPELERNVAAHAADEIVTTVITVEEYLTGWYSLVRQARRPDQVELAYKELAEAPAALARFTILTYTQAAMARFRQLQARRLNVGNMDLRIAAIALEAGAVVVSRNLRDFRRIAGLTVEDWAAPSPPAGANGADPPGDGP